MSIRQKQTKSPVLVQNAGFILALRFKHEAKSDQFAGSVLHR